MSVNRVLIYRLGSLGDTVVALSSFHLIARAFPEAERRVLTNFPVAGKAAPLSSILGESELVHGYMAYPVGLRNIRHLLALRRQIRLWKPDVLVYLAAPRGRLKALRDALFFKSCAIKSLIGIPYTCSLQQNQWLAERQCYEHESVRLARCLNVLGDAQLDNSASWDLHLTAWEKKSAQLHLDKWGDNNRFIACSVGTKIEVKDWGSENWRRLLRELFRQYPGYGLVLIGADDEFTSSESASRDWRGPRLNLCGKLTPRESAAVLKRAVLFLGHDSGPLHLAASVGVPCVAIFSARNKPGVWFPYGTQHKVLYHQTACFGCGLEVCTRYQKKCISSITVDEILGAIHQLLPSCQMSLAVEQ
jgi:ADP-heptose:LPS heptosyltransferase